VKPAQRVLNEMEGLAERYGAQAFRLSGSYSTWEQVCGTAQAILGSGLQAVYSRRGPVQWAMEKTFPFLEASGCAAMTFRVESGSQRLLDLHYGRGIEISHVERVFRACKTAGIALGVEMVYPCPEDDRHTMEETLRLLSRTRPDSVRVDLPEVTARTAWHAHSEEFGYRMDAGNGSWKRIKSGGGPNTDLGGWRTPSVGIRGLSPAQVIRVHEELLFAIEGDVGLPCFPEEVAVLARFTGYGGREGELAGLVRHQLLTGDSDALAELVGGFNKEACVPARVGAFVPFTPVPLAVGN
jgi:hypothetical protein